LRHRLHWPQGVHETRRYWLLAEGARRWCAPEAPPLERDPPPCVLPLAPGAADEAARRWQQAGLTAGTILLCPVATGTVGGQSKHWPQFQALAAQLQAQGQSLAVVAPPGLGAETAAGYPGVPVLGELPLAVFAALLARAAGVGANDSGPMHLAAAVGTPAVVPFGVTSPRRTGAWSPQLVAVQAPSGWPPVTAGLQALDRLPPREVVTRGGA
jgi:ADP-heptose:LPS heptosyltransferase